MTVLRNTGDGVTNGAAINGSNQGNSGDIITSVIATGSPTITGDTSGADVIFGAGAYKLTLASGDSAYLQWTYSSATAVGARAYFRLMQAPTASGDSLLTIRSASARIAQVQPSASGALHVIDAGGNDLLGSGSIVASSAPSSYPCVFAVDITVQPGTSTTNGSITVAYYNQDGSYALGTTGPMTANTVNMGTAPIASVRFGRYGTATNTQTRIIDDLVAQDSYGLIGTYTPPAAPNVAPTANAGPNQTSVEPYYTVTLTGSASSDSDGTIASYSWTQTGGTTVTLSDPTVVQPTFTAPGTISGDTLTFSLTVTDNQGATSTPSTVSITILNATERAVIGGSEVPMQLLAVSS